MSRDFPTDGPRALAVFDLVAEPGMSAHSRLADLATFVPAKNGADARLEASLPAAAGDDAPGTAA